MQKLFCVAVRLVELAAAPVLGQPAADLVEGDLGVELHAQVPPGGEALDASVGPGQDDTAGGRLNVVLVPREPLPRQRRLLWFMRPPGRRPAAWQ